MIFFFNDTATTEIYTLSLHDALPISGSPAPAPARPPAPSSPHPGAAHRKSTRLNSSHANISHAVFCLKKKFSDEVREREGLPEITEEIKRKILRLNYLRMHGLYAEAL